MAKEIAKVEKELNIEHWDYITISRNGDKEGSDITLYQYDLPRHIAEKYDWVIRWRTASKAKAKLARKREAVKQAEERLIEKVKHYKENH